MFPAGGISPGTVNSDGEVGQALEEYKRASKNELPALSSREKEILGLIAEGYTNSQVAEKYSSASLQWRIN